MKFPIGTDIGTIERVTQSKAKKVSFEEYLAFKKRYFLGFMNPMSPYFHLRYGQAFINEMLDEVVDSKVFYTSDEDIAEREILKKYISYE